MKIGISQPALLPWLGYFDIMRSVDVFVYLDTVQLAPRTWPQRNRIKTPQGLQWISVPLHLSENSRPMIRAARIFREGFPEKQLRSIEVNYRKSPAFDSLFPELVRQWSEQHPEDTLSQLNIPVIDWYKDYLGINTKTVRASDLNVEGKRSSLLVEICKALGGKQYFSTIGAADYLQTEKDIFRAAGIDVFLHQYEHPTYPQRHGDFLPYACILDLAMNVGKEARGILESGHREWQRLE